MILIFLFSLLCLGLFAQVRTTNDLSLVKEVAVKGLLGKKFRAGVDMRNVPADSIGLAGFFVLQVGKGDYDFVAGSAKSKSATSADTLWHHYELEGKIEQSAQKIWLYVNTRGNGDFYYDNFTLEIQGPSGEWNSLKIGNGDFSETGSPLNGFKGGEVLKEKSKVSVEYVMDPGSRYMQHVRVHSRGAISFYNYGRNTLKGRYVAVNGAKIYYETYGKGEPLLLMHGNGGSINAFREQIEEFAKHYQVIAVDTRGQGKSEDKTSERFSYELFAQDMKLLLDSLGLKKVNVLGWSDGGNTALIMAMKYPSLVEKLVVMGANLNPEVTSVSPKILKQTRNDLAGLKAKNNASNRIDIMLLELLLKEPNIMPMELKKITAKTLVLAGEKDIILEAHTRAIAGGITGGEVMILKNQSHFVPQENPSLFNRIVLDFLQRP